MALSHSPKIVAKGLVFGFDTGYPLVSKSHQSYKYNKGEPTTTFDIGTMVPTNPNTYFISNSAYHSNLHGTVWDWSYYPNSNISSDGGMEWMPNEEGPGFKGAWKMKKRAGGNSESNFSGTAPGSIDQDKDYTVSVWCKTDQASMARIHLNTTKDGSSYWGYGSSYHTGGGDWERLSVTIPAGAGNTSLNVIRCQCVGTSINADSYWRDYQVEQRSHATPFILGGTRSATDSLIDLTRTIDIDVSNASFDDNAKIAFDGTDDYLDCGTVTMADNNFSLEVIFEWDDIDTSSIGFLIAGNYEQLEIHTANNNTLRFIPYDYPNNSVLDAANIITSGINHVVFTAQNLSYSKAYKNGELFDTASTISSVNLSTSQTVKLGSRTNNSYYFDGKIYLARIYNRTLTADEISQNFNAIRGRFGI